MVVALVRVYVIQAETKVSFRPFFSEIGPSTSALFSQVRQLLGDEIPSPTVALTLRSLSTALECEIQVATLLISKKS